MKCFLTGISGFIGQNLAHRLIAEGWSVHPLVRRLSNELQEEFPGLKFIQGGLGGIQVLADAMQGCDTVFHVAGLAKPWAKDPREYYRTNVEGTVNILEAAMRAGVRRVVFTSSAATISPSDGDTPSDETTLRTIPWFNEYEATKAEAEQRCRDYCSKGLEVVTVNPSRVYGPGPLNPSNSVTKMISGYRKGTWRIIPGDGKNIGNYVYIDDVVNGHILAARKGRAGERYILGGENLSFNELFLVLSELTGTRRRMVNLPLGVMTAVAQLMEWQTRYTGIPPAITEDFVRKYLNQWSLSSEKAIRELGYCVTPFRTGVEKTLGWLTRPN